MPQHTGWFLAFCALALLVVNLSPGSLRRYVQLAFSLSFAALVDPRAALLVGALGVLARAVPARRAWLPLTIGLPTLVLLTTRAIHAELPRIELLVGFAFTTLRLIHYGAERTRGALPEHDLVSLLGWLFFFPSALVGPVQRFEEWLRCEARARWDDGAMAVGVRRVIHGYAKVLILGYWLVGQQLAGWLSEGTLPVVVQAGVARCLGQWACFAGYTDIAIGLGAVLGQRLPENFRWPLLQPDLGAFWRSWHASVSDWCRTYVYQPTLLALRSRTLAALASMGVLGLWHEISLRYIVWGLYHGLGIAVWQGWRSWEGRPRLPGPPWAGRLLGTTLTASFVLGGFILNEVLR